MGAEIMRRLVIVLSLVLGLPAACLAETPQEHLAKGDAAFGKHDYQAAENSYTDAFYAVQGDAQTPVLSKLAELYKVSGLTPLDATIKDKLAHFGKTKSAPAAPAAVVAKTVAPKSALPEVKGEKAKKIIAGCRAGFEGKCRQELKESFVSFDNFTATVFKMPDGNFQVFCNCEVVTREGRAPTDMIMVLKELGPDKFETVSADVMQADLAGSSEGQTASFSNWLNDQKKNDAQADASARAESERIQNANQQAEAAQLNEFEARTKALEEMSNSSNQKSKNK
jgi:hypothetical protein